MINQSQEYSDEIDLMDMIKVLFRQKITIAVTFFLVFLTGAIYTFMLAEPVYESEGIIRIGQIEQALMSPEQAKATLRSSKILKPAAGKLSDAPKPYDLREALRLEIIRNTNLLKISFKNKNPNFAFQALEAIGYEFIKKGNVLYEEKIALVEGQIRFLTARKKIIKNEIKALREQDLSFSDSFFIYDSQANYEKIYADLSGKFYDLKNKKSNALPFEFFEYPNKPNYPIKPNKQLNMVITSFLGLFLGILLAFFRNYMSTYKEQRIR